ncbi:hypothetical protein SteCoe_34281 [Stentor coeruleus]|uniref:Uncharacterized protein n=1 Tax=Stentor coeruleus TaxID=5963 RepID=A0A1R2AV37_9CILI|nr:hypothetical protein SteCoe_34281 [Stentor coeruleus]
METKFLSVSNKSFDYKLPLIKQTYGYNYASNPIFRKSKNLKLRSRLDFNTTFSSLSIKGLNSTINRMKSKKSIIQKNYASTQYLNFPKNNRIHYKKKDNLIIVTPESKNDEKFELSGWDIN